MLSNVRYTHGQYWWTGKLTASISDSRYGTEAQVTVERLEDRKTLRVTVVSGVHERVEDVQTSGFFWDWPQDQKGMEFHAKKYGHILLQSRYIDEMFHNRPEAIGPKLPFDVLYRGAKLD